MSPTTTPRSTVPPHWIILLATLLGAFFAMSADCPAQSCWMEQQKVLADDEPPSFWYGVSVSLSGDAALVGDIGVSAEGGAWILRQDRSGWQQEQKLTSGTGTVEGFGISVSLSGDVALVGAPFNGAGKAYVFRYDGSSWVKEQELVASDGRPGDALGIAVALVGNVAVLGAPDNDEMGVGSGAVYVYRYDGKGWVAEQKLTASDASGGDEFGVSVAVDGNVIAVGAWDAEAGGVESGAAYAYRYDGFVWGHERKLFPGDGARGDWYGVSVSASSSSSGEVILVGSPFNDSARGAAYLYRFDGVDWPEEQKLLASDAAPSKWFGRGVALSRDLAAVGSVDLFGGVGHGAYVYRYSSGTWFEEAKLTPGGGPVDQFGYSLDMAEETVLVGAHKDDEQANDAGSVYVFLRSEFGLHVDPGTVRAGDLLTFLTSGGTPAGPGLLVLVNANGAPITRFVTLGVFAANGQWSYANVVPPGLEGNAVGFASFAYAWCTGKLTMSEEKTVVFQ